MSEITIFSLALLAVPVLARFADVPGGSKKIYHLIGLGGLFLLLGEFTRLIAIKFTFVASVMPAIDVFTALFAYISMIVGSIWVAIYYIQHLKEA